MTSLCTGNPLLRPAALLAVMLSLSIGWGIRGNYGHEYGAMIPGALAAIAISLFSGREDWRRRVPFFAFLGAMGWAFGGSISYMPVISYTHSGQPVTQIYGFLMVFAVGFLWSSLGVAGIAYAAVEERARLTALFRPLAWILAAWGLQYFLEPALLSWYALRQGLQMSGSFRQCSPLYWLDSDWVGVSLALLALAAFDLWDRKGEKAQWLVVYAGVGGLAGYAMHRALAAMGWLEPLLTALVHPQGDPEAASQALGRTVTAAEMITNWPQLFFDLGPHMGWMAGLVAGAALYFARFGQWRCEARLPLYMALGGFGVFLAGPVLLSNLFKSAGGFRMVPPRGDNWAFVLGYFVGMLLYMRRRGLQGVNASSIIGGILGGLGFMVVQFLKIVAWMPGNPLLTSDPQVINNWAHWRSANWHSILAEQGAGLLYGLAAALALVLVSSRVPLTPEEPRSRRWTEYFCVGFLLTVLLYVNLVKNVADWTRLQLAGFRAVPLSMKMPLLTAVELSALGWFNVAFVALAACVVGLLVCHSRRRLAVVPDSWLGRGQLLYLVFLWAVIIGNFMKALVAFHESRLATELAVWINGCLATFLLLALVPEPWQPPSVGGQFTGVLRKGILRGGIAVLLLSAAFTLLYQSVYGARHDGYGGHLLRFGPEATWRVRPVVKTAPHR